jgi:hypothetical protein
MWIIVQRNLFTIVDQLRDFFPSSFVVPLLKSGIAKM